MRTLTVGLLVGAAALSLAACNKSKDTTDARNPADVAAAPEGSPLNPKRKPGLWEQSITMAGQPAPMLIKLCLDEATDAKMSAFGNQASKDACSENTVTKTADGYSFKSVCDMGQGGVATAQGKAVGDMSSSYTVDMTSVTTGAALASANGTSRMQMTAKWVGPCPAGMAPGMMEMPGGLQVNVNQAMGGAAAAK